MPIVLVGFEKGGSGKTTVATNLAAMRQNRGFDTVLIDTDSPQLTSTLWANVRAENAVENPNIKQVLCITKTGRLAWDVVKVAEKYDTVIIDVGGRDSQELRYAMAIADVAVMPLRPSQFDSWSVDTMQKIIKEAKEATQQERPFDANRYKLLINAVNPNPMMKEHEEVRELLRDYTDYMVTLPFVLYDRVSIRRASRDGLSVTELPSGSADHRASEEFEMLYREVFGNDNQ